MDSEESNILRGNWVVERILSMGFWPCGRIGAGQEEESFQGSVQTGVCITEGTPTHSKSHPSRISFKKISVSLISLCLLS